MVESLSMASVAKLVPFQFLKEAQIELKKVSWPTRNQAFRLTAIVIGASVVVGVYIGALDFIFTKVLGIYLTK